MSDMQHAPSTPLVVTMGDPAGIGPEITIKAFETFQEQGRPFPFVLLSDPTFLSTLTEVPIKTLSSIDAFDSSFSGLSVLPVPLAEPVVAGQGNPANGAAVVRSIQLAVDLIQSGKASAMVTPPINKDVLYQTGFSFPGHTEFLSDLCGGQTPVMMLAGGGLRVVPVTIHIPLHAVSDSLTREAIVENGRILHADLQSKFGLAAPRIAVAGLNPHAGENGSIGREEIDIITPAIDDLVRNGIAASGPYPADTLFHAGSREKYDAVLCMYHDQALIPLKTLDFDGGVNITLGLPLIRTSPDHGTAYDIAGKGIASARSIIAAMDTALEMVARGAS